MQFGFRFPFQQKANFMVYFLCWLGPKQCSFGSKSQEPEPKAWHWANDHGKLGNWNLMQLNWGGDWIPDLLKKSVKLWAHFGAGKEFGENPRSPGGVTPQCHLLKQTMLVSVWKTFFLIPSSASLVHKLTQFLIIELSP